MDIQQLFDAILRQNQPNKPFYLQYRPDFDHAYKKFHNSVELHKLWIQGVELNNLADLNRLYFLYENVSSLIEQDIPGAFGELGVYKGNTAKLFHTLAPNRNLYLFDTFSGFDAAAPMPHEVPDDYSRFDDTSIDYVKNFIGPSDKVHYCQGKFPETIDLVPEGTQFAFVHLDCDLYQPMKDGLEYFYPRLSPGALLVIHDYSSGCWPGITKAVDEFFEDKVESLIRIPDKSGTVVMSKNKSTPQAAP